MKLSYPIDFTYAKVAIVTITVAAAINGLDSRQLAAGEPGWRSGASVWNGNGYDLPNAPDETLPTKIVAEEPPYVVPSEPGRAQTNPYFQPSTGSQGSAGNSSSAVGFSPPVNSSGESLSELVESLTDPYGQSSTPFEPIISPSEFATHGTDTQGSTVASESTYADPPPLEQDVIRWYQYPQSWMKGWDSHAEFGVDGSDGNANTLAIQTGLELKRKTDLHTLAIDIDSRQARTNNATAENNGRVNIDYDRIIADTPWSAFGKFGLEWDRFKAFDLRLNLNGGVGYYWVREDDASLVTRFGAGASREIGAPIDEWTPEAVFGIDAERQLNSRNKLKGKLDYFPAWEDFGDYRVVADAAWEILLDEEDNLSLKVAVTDRYDSTPQGAKPNDVYYSLLLLYKF